MRTLSSTLLAEQKKSSVTPYVRVYLEDASGIISYTFTTADTPTRLYSVRHIEEPYGGVAIIRLRNNDGYFNSRNLRGYKVHIGWGMVTSAGNEYSEPAYLNVLSQRDISEEGELLTELTCIDIWGLLAREDSFAGGTKLIGKVSVKTSSAILEKLTGQTSGATGTIYQHASNWVAVVGVTGTFQAGETATSTNLTIEISSVEAIGTGGLAPAYSGDTNVFTIIEQMLLGFTTLTLDSDDPDNTAQTYYPRYRVPIGTPLRAVIQDVIGFTRCGLRMRTDGMHMLYLDPAPISADYEYDSSHVHLSNRRDQGLVIPTQIYVINSDPDDTTVPAYIGSAYDSGSYGALGRHLSRIVNIPTVQSDADAAKRAEQLIARAKADTNTGIVTVPIMNCGQEIYDWIKITDTRNANLIFEGRVGRIQRDYDRGVSSMELRLGGLMTAAEITPIGAVESNVQQIEGAPIDHTPVHLEPWKVPAAIQGFEHDIDFSAVDWDTVQWTAGTIKFYDGTTQSILSGTYDIPDYVVRYIYFDLDDASPNVLKVTDNYLSVMTTRTGIVCIIQKSTDTGVNPTIIPSRGKMPLITADIIYLTGLLDRLPDGTYGKVLSTQISAGNLKLTSATIKDGVWYNESGVIIDANTGIEIRGNLDLKFTYAGSYAAYIYVGTAGDLALLPDVNAEVWILQEGLFANNLRLPNSAYFGTYGSTAQKVLFNTASTWQGTSGVDHKLCPSIFDGTLGWGYLGDANYFWYRVYANTYYGKNTTIQAFQEQDDIALVKAIKSTRIKDKDGTEREVIDIDSLPDGVKYVERGVRVDRRARLIGRANEEADRVDAEEEVTEERVPYEAKFINLGSFTSLAIGALQQLIERVEALERRIR